MPSDDGPMHDTIFEALKSGATLVTASQRLARQLQADFGRRMQQAGRSAWASPDILPWKAWIERYWDSTFGLALVDPDTSPRVLLTPTQEMKLWEAVIADSAWNTALLQVPAAARTAQEAWRLLHEWRLPLPAEREALNEDTRAFAGWAVNFDKRCDRGRWQDAARVPALLTRACERGRLEAPARLLLAGFDELTPQQQQLFDSLRTLGTGVERLAPAPMAAAAARLTCQDALEEITLAARWARRILETDTGARIGVVVPDLAALGATVTRVFDDIFLPAAALPLSGATTRPYNLSLGRRLLDYPPVHSAMQILELASGELAHTQAGSLLRSPFLGGAEDELSRRAQLDAELRSVGETVVTLGFLAHKAAARDKHGQPRAWAAPLLAALLQRLRAVQDTCPARQTPSAWAESFSRLLLAAGWPGPRALTSEEYQTVEAWRKLLVELAGFDAITGRVDQYAALATLRRLAAERVFQPQSPEVPVQILGVLEAAGLRFDHLWLMGLHDGVWPASPRPNPFLPIELQRRHGLPHASAERELAFACRTTERLLASAPTVIVSHPARAGDADLRPSPLLASLPAVERSALELAAHEPYRDVIYKERSLESLLDTQAPPPEGQSVARGTAVFKDQAACPFRAFARVRLCAAPLDEPRPGLDDSVRGSLLHDVLARLWRDLGSHAVLCASPPDELQTRVRAAVQAAIAGEARDRRQTFTARFTGLEQQRLETLALEWLALEKQRAPFTVVATEAREAVSFGGLTVSAIVDRLDELADGTRAVIDYKTGSPKLSQWFGARPDEPQLPLYSAARERVAAVLFARVRRGDMKFIGAAQRAGIVPGVAAFDATRDDSRDEGGRAASGDGRDAGGRATQGAVAGTVAEADHGSWDGLLGGWRAVLDVLGQSFRRGDAPVDPKDRRTTCEYCALTALCRVHEREAATLVSPEADEA